VRDDERLRRRHAAVIRRFDFVVVDVDAAVPLAHRRAYAAAQQVQIQQHIAPAWQGDPTMTVRAATPDQPPREGEVEIRLMSKPTLPGALGYHDQKDDGTPICYVFCRLAQSLNTDWTAVASHEVCEILGDPRGRLAVEMDDGFWDREIADRVEGDTYVIEVTVDGFTAKVVMSNFNYPECFEPSKKPPADVKYDHLGLSKKPNEIRANGGYAQRFDAQKGWVQLGQMSAYRAHLASLGLGRNVRRRARNPARSWLSRAWDAVFGH
jgi:hypothetical protein